MWTTLTNLWGGWGSVWVASTLFLKFSNVMGKCRVIPISMWEKIISVEAEILSGFFWVGNGACISMHGDVVFQML